jgi:AcrR family transcriptional regulator
MLDSLDLILRTTPWRMVRVTDIAEESGCSPALFYNYFPTLESAFEELWERMSHQGGRKFEHAVQIRALFDCELTLKGR